MSLVRDGYFIDLIVDEVGMKGTKEHIEFFRVMKKMRFRCDHAKAEGNAHETW